MTWTEFFDKYVNTPARAKDKNHMLLRGMVGEMPFAVLYFLIYDTHKRGETKLKDIITDENHECIILFEKVKQATKAELVEISNKLNKLIEFR
jgi:hypothetical protein